MNTNIVTKTFLLIPFNAKGIFDKKFQYPFSINPEQTYFLSEVPKEAIPKISDYMDTECGKLGVFVSMLVMGVMYDASKLPVGVDSTLFFFERAWEQIADNNVIAKLEDTAALRDRMSEFFSSIASALSETGIEEEEDEESYDDSDDSSVELEEDEEDEDPSNSQQVTKVFDAQSTFFVPGTTTLQ